MLVKLLFIALFSIIIIVILKTGKQDDIQNKFNRVVLSTIIIVINFVFIIYIHPVSLNLLPIITVDSFYVGGWIIYLGTFASFSILSLFSRYIKLNPFILNRFYDVEEDGYYLKPDYIGYNKYFFAFVIALTISLILSIAVTGLDLVSGFSSLIWSPIILIIISLYHFFDGNVKLDIRQTDIIAKGNTTKQNWNYDQIHDLYNKYFNEFILYDLKYRKKDIDHYDKINLNEQLQSSHLLITDPLNEGLLLSLGNLITNEKKLGFHTLIVDNDASIREDFEEYLNNYDHEIKILNEDVYSRSGEIEEERYDILILSLRSFQEVINTINLWNPRIVILPTAGLRNYDDIIAYKTNNNSQTRNEQIRFLIIAENWNNVEPVVRLLHNLGDVREIEKISGTEFQRHLIIWDNNHANYYHEKIYSEVEYISPPVVLSLFPISAKLDDFYWSFNGQFECDSFETINNISSKISIDELRGEYFRPADLEILQSFRVISDSEKRFLIIFDNHNNLPFLINTLDNHLSIRDEFINILSSRYLLRNYFLKHIDFFLSQPLNDYVFPIISIPQDSVKLTLILLHNNLIENWISSDEIKTGYFANEDYWKLVLDLEVIVIDLDFLIKIFSIFDETHEGKTNITRRFLWNKNHIDEYFKIDSSVAQVERELYFSFVCVSSKKPLITYLSVSIENFIYKLRLDDAIPVLEKGENQIKYYKIDSINIKERKIFTNQEHPVAPNYHHPIIEFSVKRVISRKDKAKIEIDNIVGIEKYFLAFNRKITKVISCKDINYLDLRYCKIITNPEGIFPKEMISKEYLFTNALRFTIIYEHEHDLSRIAFTLCMTIKEVLKSIFPLVADQIHVLSENIIDEYQPVNIDEEPFLKYLQEIIPTINFTEDQTSLNDNEVSLWIVEESSIGLGVVDYLYKDKYEDLWFVINDYLQFYQENIKSENYLFFGLDMPEPQNSPYDFENALNLSKMIIGNQKNRLTTNRTGWHLDVNNNNFQKLSKTKSQYLYCEFCGKEITNEEFSELEDGRNRCKHCSIRLVNSIDDLKDLLQLVIGDIKKIFGAIVENIDKFYFVNASELYEMMSEAFLPQNPEKSRIVGFARLRNERFEVVVENGAPYWKTYKTLAHELTHIWQYQNLDHQVIEKEIVLIEGHAEYVAYNLLQIHVEHYEREVSYLIESMKERANLGDDEYGQGLKLFMEECGEKNPFEFVFQRIKEVSK